MTGDALFLLLLSGHIVGAFLLQSEMPMQRRRGIDWMRPALLYLLSVTAFLLPFLTFTNLYVPLLMAITWLPLEFLCTRPAGLFPVRNANRKMGKGSRPLPTSLYHRHTGSMPQTGFILQNGIMFLLSALLAHFSTLDSHFGTNPLWIPIIVAWSTMQLPYPPISILRYLLIFLILGKPANMLIRQTNRKGNIVLPLVTEEPPVLGSIRKEPEYRNAGSLIGTLERFLIVAMMLQGQYAAIGLIFTAKSITRYDRISKDPSFAEYYLVGTLMSVLIAVFTVLLLKPV